MLGTSMKKEAYTSSSRGFEQSPSKKLQFSNGESVTSSKVATVGAVRVSKSPSRYTLASPSSTPKNSPQIGAVVLTSLEPIKDIVTKFENGAELWRLMTTLPTQAYYDTFAALEAELLKRPALLKGKDCAQDLLNTPQSIHNVLFNSNGVFYTVTGRDYSTIQFGVKHIAVTVLIEKYTGTLIKNINHMDKCNQMFAALESLHFKLELFLLNNENLRALQKLWEILEQLCEYIYLHIKCLRLAIDYKSVVAVQKSTPLRESSVKMIISNWHPVPADIESKEMLDCIKLAQDFNAKMRVKYSVCKTVTESYAVPFQLDDDKECGFIFSSPTTSPVRNAFGSISVDDATTKTKQSNTKKSKKRSLNP